MSNAHDTPCRYERLPGKGQARRFLSFSAFLCSLTLWLGPDHLLQIERTGYSERYKRFRFRDIQAFIIRPCPEIDKLRSFISASLALLLLAGGATIGGQSWYFFAPMAAAMLIWLIVKLSLGPSCCCHLWTAVQTENLASLHRLRNARRVLARLRPLILAAQADWSPAAGSADDAPDVATPPAADLPDGAAVSVPPPLLSGASAADPAMVSPVFNRKCHYGLFVALMGLSATAWLCLLAAHPATLMMMFVAGMVVGAMAIAGLIQAHRAQVGGGLVVATWAGGALPVVLFFGYYIFTMYLAAMQMQDMNDQWRLLLLACEEIAEGVVAKTLLGVIAGAAAVLSAWGYRCLRQPRHERALSPPPLPGLASGVKWPSSPPPVIPRDEERP